MLAVLRCRVKEKVRDSSARELAAARLVLRVFAEDDLAAARRMNAWIESEILRMPAQYLWVHRRFKTRPPGTPDLYALDDAAALAACAASPRSAAAMRA